VRGWSGTWQESIVVRKAEVFGNPAFNTFKLIVHLDMYVESGVRYCVVVQ
jgi:hypothetical protein